MSHQNTRRSGLCLILAALFLLSSCTTSDSPVSPPTSSFITPIEVGNRWVYRNTWYDTLGNVRVVFTDTVRIHRDTLIRGEKWYYLDSAATISTLITNKTDGLWSMMVYSNGTIFNPPLLVAKYPVTLNESWSNWNGKSATLVSQSKSVDVPFGKYFCLQYNYTDTAINFLMQSNYFSVGTGLIQEEHYFQSSNPPNKITTVRELISFTK